MGRQVLRSKDARNQIVSMFRAGVSLSGCAGGVGISQQALSVYLARHPSFHRELGQALSTEIVASCQQMQRLTSKSKTSTGSPSGLIQRPRAGFKRHPSRSNTRTGPA